MTARKPLGDAARAARKEALLDEASREFNRRGVASADLAKIAARVGFSRASLYNYCKDREDLARQTYLRACMALDRSLARATNLSGSALDRVETFLRLALEFDEAPRSVLNEVGYLPASYQAEVRAARAANVERLGDLLKRGIVDGSVRDCDPELAAETILGVLSWAPLATTWTGNSDVTFAIRTAAVIPDLLVNGIAAGGVVAATPGDLRARVLRLGDGLMSTSRLEDVARAGSRLFNAKGIDGVSLDDVAGQLGSTKGRVYHYFASKPDFVAFCYERAFGLYDAIMDEAAEGTNGLDRAHIGLSMNVLAQIEDLHPLTLGATYDTFGEDVQRRFTARTNHLYNRAVDRIRIGVKDGSLRPIDIEPVALASAGVFNHLARWWPSNRRSDTEIAAEQVSSILLYGLRAQRRP